MKHIVPLLLAFFVAIMAHPGAADSILTTLPITTTITTTKAPALVSASVPGKIGLNANGLVSLPTVPVPVPASTSIKPLDQRGLNLSTTVAAAPPAPATVTPAAPSLLMALASLSTNGSAGLTVAPIVLATTVPQPLSSSPPSLEMTTLHPCSNPNITQCFALIQMHMNQTETLLAMANKTLSDQITQNPAASKGARAPSLAPNSVSNATALQAKKSSRKKRSNSMDQLWGQLDDLQRQHHIHERINDGLSMDDPLSGPDAEAAHQGEARLKRSLYNLAERIRARRQLGNLPQLQQPLLQTQTLTPGINSTTTTTAKSLIPNLPGGNVTLSLGNSSDMVSLTSSAVPVVQSPSLALDNSSSINGANNSLMGNGSLVSGVVGSVATLPSGQGTSVKSAPRNLILEVKQPGDSNLTVGQLVDGSLNPVLDAQTTSNQTLANSTSSLNLSTMATAPGSSGSAASLTTTAQPLSSLSSSINQTTVAAAVNVSATASTTSPMVDAGKNLQASAGVNRTNLFSLPTGLLIIGGSKPQNSSGLTNATVDAGGSPNRTMSVSAGGLKPPISSGLSSSMDVTVVATASPLPAVAPQVPEASPPNAAAVSVAAVATMPQRPA